MVGWQEKLCDICHPVSSKCIAIGRLTNDPIGRPSGDPSQVEVTTGDWTIVGGAGRCARCIKDNARCVLNLRAIEGWKKDFRAGKRSKQHPPGTNCLRCTGKRKSCELPATEEMRTGKRYDSGDGSSTSSAGSSKKRKRQAYVELRPRKKVRVAEERRGEERSSTEILADLAQSSARIAAATEKLYYFQRLTLAHQGVQNKLLMWILEELRRDGTTPSFEEIFAIAKREFGSVAFEGHQGDDEALEETQE